MNSNSKKATFTLPVDLVLYLQSKENQAAFVAEALRKAKEEEEAKIIKKAVCDMKECKELWDELKDWDITLEDE
ncbi:MAG: hypothetical protein A3I68_02340 [Candidatus Melainabacteria bacterium RIFCSPLOWO2_02_FULL_35_15]|nr:MAG: hypothetical protein A3F80_08810 [Candidatus Melainabacteria bacterium RIFCSPLOWO2_12_FULL_35_11]OGI13246.1 MAG: hypothetical protein A3I68_02340 [Candidatus Melainabacteria bacterium RIFCSPLOWO2_02_FULL_35_15]